MRDHGVEPCASVLSGQRSTDELITRNTQGYIIHPLVYLQTAYYSAIAQKKSTIQMRLTSTLDSSKLVLIIQRVDCSTVICLYLLVEYHNFQN